MKTNNLIFKIMIAALLVVTTSSCSDLFSEHDTSYQGPDLVEFTPLSDLIEVPAGATGTVSTTAQLIGDQRSSDLTFGVEVVDSLTTAVEGDHFTMLSNSVTIPAESSSAVYEIQVTGEDFGGGSVDIAVALQGADGVEPAENLRTYTITLVNP